MNITSIIILLQKGFYIVLDRTPKFTTTSLFEKVLGVGN